MRTAGYPTDPALFERCRNPQAPFLPMLLLCLVCLTSSLQAHIYEAKFETISIEQGLSQSSVRSIMQDSRGFLWFGTEDGLNKYNGYGFKVYRPHPDDPNALSSSFIYKIFEGRSGVLWIGTNGGGLNRFEPSLERFTRYLHDPEDPNSLSNNFVWDILEDGSGKLWIATDGGGLNSFDPKSEEFTHYMHDPDDAGSLSQDAVLSLCEDGSGTLWIGTRSGGINKFDHRTGLFKRYQNDPNNPNSLSSNSIRTLYVDGSGVFWIGTADVGLDRFDPTEETFVHFRYDPKDPGSLSRGGAWSIREDRNGVLWVGTNGGGLNRFDREKETFVRYQHEPNRAYSLSDNNIFSIYEDRSGVLWVGTESGGLNKLKSSSEKFMHYQIDPLDIDNVGGNNVWSIFEDRNGTLWIGTRAGGLKEFDRKSERITHYRNDPGDPNSLSNNHVRCIYEAPSEPDVLWLGTDGGGLNRSVRPDGEISPLTFRHYSHEPGDSHGLSGDRVYSILEDHSGTLWIGTRTGGLNRFDREKQQFTHFVHDPDDTNSLSDNFIYKIYEDRSGVMWIGTFAGGLNRLDRENERFTSYRNDVDDPNSLSNNAVLTIYEDGSGVLWIGTGGGGLNRFDPKKEEFVQYGVHSGLPNEVIYGILEDDRGNLWLSHNSGLSKFDPKSETLKNYNMSDGLQSNEFNGGAYFKSSTGEMFFGGINGFNSFHPADIVDNKHIPEIVITDFRLFNRSIPIGKTEHGRTILGKSIIDTKEIKLAYNENSISFEFAALDFTIPDKNMYMHILEGYDADWVHTKADRRYTNYKNIPPGDYTFMVKGSNNDGIWNEGGVSLKLVITPPFWETWWFRTPAILLIVLLAYVLYKRRLNNVSMRVELQSAHVAQMSIMPRSDPIVKGFDISGVCIPANTVGGDFFDYLWLDKEKSKFGIAVGDVAGKAMEAAMIAVMSNGMIYVKADEVCCPRDVMTRLNYSIYQKTDEMMFTALCFASIDIRSKKMVFANAGLNNPLIKSDDHVSEIESSGLTLPLGAFLDTQYQETEVQLKANNVVVFYTDGIPSARNRTKEFYDDYRLKDLMKGMKASKKTAREIKESIITDVKSFTGNTKQCDDITVVVVKVL